MMSAARRWADCNRLVFPAGADKRPLTPNGLLDATTDPERIERWWKRNPDANIAIRTGALSNLVVLDVDGPEGADSLRELERRYGELPPTPSVITPRGGAHFYFRHPGEPVKTSASLIAPGIDIRGDGGYVLAPPSVGENGRAYQWDSELPPADMPAWLVAAVSADRPRPRAPEPASTWFDMVANGLPEGRRNDGLARLVGHLLARDVDAHLVAAIAYLVNARSHPPLDEDEVDRIIESIARRERRKREGSR